MTLQTPSIRRATPGDAAALSAFAASVFALGCPQTAPGDLAAYIAAALTPPALRVLLEDPNVFVLLAETSAPDDSASQAASPISTSRERMTPSMGATMVV